MTAGQCRGVGLRGRGRALGSLTQTRGRCPSSEAASHLVARMRCAVSTGWGRGHQLPRPRGPRREQQAEQTPRCVHWGPEMPAALAPLDKAPLPLPVRCGHVRCGARGDTLGFFKRSCKYGIFSVKPIGFQMVIFFLIVGAQQNVSSAKHKHYVRAWALPYLLLRPCVQGHSGAVSVKLMEWIHQ